MAELRRSRGGSGGGARRPRRSSGQREGRQRESNGGRSSQSRRIGTRPGSIPKWAYIALIAVPSTGILILLIVSMFKGSEPPKAPQVDPNDEIAVLQAQIPKLRKSQQELFALFQKEDPRAEAKFEELRDRFYVWIERWDKFFDAKRDENDRLPPEYAGYTTVRSQVNMMLVDLTRSSPF